MPIPVTVKPVYNSTNNTLINYIKWEVSGLTSDLTTTLYRSIGVSSYFYNYEVIAADQTFKINNYIDKDVIPGKQYYYLLYASDEEFPVLTEPVSSVTSTTPILSQIPEPPQKVYELLTPLNFSINFNKSNLFEFFWDFSSTNYNPIFIEYSKGNNSQFKTLVSQIDASKNRFILNDVSFGDVCYFRAYTQNEEGETSNFSNIVSLFSNKSTFISPQTPTDLAITGISQTSLRITWTNNNPLESSLEHLIWISTPGSPLVLLDSIKCDPENPSTASSFTVTGLNKSTIYCFVCQARNSGGSSDLSLPVEGYTIELETAPNSPTALSGSNVFEVFPTYRLTNAQNLRWVNPIINNSSERYLQYATNPSFTSASSISLPINETQALITDLESNTTYYYRLSSVNSIGSVTSTSASIFMPNPPALPTGLGATAIGQTTIQTSWTDNSADEVEFLLQVSGGIYPNYTEIVVVPSATTSYVFENLDSNTAYNFLIYSVGFGGFSGTPSTWASATATTQGVTLSVPERPINLYASGQVDLTTYKITFEDRSTDEDNFELTLYTKVTNNQNSNVPRAQIINIPGVAGSGTIVEYNLSNLVPDTVYQVTLRSKNQTGYSNFANVSGSTSDVLELSTSPFIFGTTSLAIEVSGTSGIYQQVNPTTLQMYNYPLLNLEWYDPFDYGDGYTVFLKGPDNSTIELISLPPIKDQYNKVYYTQLSPIMVENIGLTIFVKKFLNTFGSKVYSSSIERFFTIGSLSNGPEFIPDNPEDLRVSLISIPNESQFPKQISALVEWNPVERTDTLTLERINNRNTSEIITLISEPPVGLLNRYVDVFSSTTTNIDYTYKITLTNNTVPDIVTKNKRLFFRQTPTIPTGLVNARSTIDGVGAFAQSPPGSTLAPASSITLRWRFPPQIFDEFGTQLSLINYTISLTDLETNELVSSVQVPIKGFEYPPHFIYQEFNPYLGFYRFLSIPPGAYKIELIGNTLNNRTLLPETTLAEIGVPYPVLVRPEEIDSMAEGSVDVSPNGYVQWYRGSPFQDHVITWKINPKLIDRVLEVNAANYPLYQTSIDKMEYGLYNNDFGIIELGVINPNPETWTNKEIKYQKNTGPLPVGTYNFYLLCTISGFGQARGYESTITVTQKSPDVIQNLRVTRATRSQVIITWERASYSSGYKIRKTTTNSDPVVDFIEITDPNQTSYTDVNLIPGSLVTYEITTLVPGGESEYSRLLSVSVPDDPEPPLPPTVVDAPRVCPTGTSLKAGNVYYRVRRT